jgi:hypothetical protein
MSGMMVTARWLTQGERMSAAAPPGAVSSPEDDTPSDETKRERHAVALIGLAFLLVLMGTIGVLYDGNLLWLNRLAHPFLFGCLATAAFGAGLCQLLSTPWLRNLVTTAGIIVFGGWFLIGLMLVSVDGGRSLIPAATADAPGDHEYKAVVHKEQSWIGEPYYDVSIRQTRGLLSREWPAGCISGESLYGGTLAIHQVRWQSPTRLRVTLGWEGYGITIRVDPRTGKPKPPAHETC